VLKKLAEGEAEREFRAELALWDAIQRSTEPTPFEDYLRGYPNGRFTELAQLQLDRVLAALGEKKAVVVVDRQNPYTKGTAATNTVYRLGDSYTCDELDLLTGKRERSFTRTVKAITPNEIIFGPSRFITDLLGNTLQDDETVWTPNQTTPTEFAVGKRWRTRFDS
jgi:hypothetical protein